MTCARSIGTIADQNLEIRELAICAARCGKKKRGIELTPPISLLANCGAGRAEMQVEAAMRLIMIDENCIVADG